MAYVIPKIEDILDDNDLNDNLARAKNRAAVLRAEKASLEAEKAAGKKYDSKRLSEVSIEVTELDDFISREPTVRNKVAQQVAARDAKKSKEEAEAKTKQAETDFQKTYDTELDTRATRGGKPDFDILAGLTPEQRQLIDTSNTGKGYSWYRNAFNALNPIGLAWLLGDSNERIKANAMGMDNFRRYGSAGFEGAALDQDIGTGKVYIPGGLTTKEYLALIAAGDVDTLAKRTGATTTDIPTASAAGLDPKVQAGVDYRGMTAQKADAEAARTQAADINTDDFTGPENQPGYKRLAVKNYISPILQGALGLGTFAYSKLNGGSEYTSEDAAFDDNARNWIRSDVDKRRVESQKTTIKEFEKKQKKSSDVLANALWSIMGTGINDYGSRDVEQVKKSITPNYADGKPGSLKFAGVSGEKDIMDMALAAANAYERGDDEGYETAKNINANLNTKLTSMGYKSRTPVIIGGFDRSTELGQKGAAILLPNEDGQGYRVVMIPIRQGRFGSPYDTSRQPESLPDISGLGSNFTIQEYLKLPGAQDALNAAEAARAATSNSDKKQWRWTPATAR